MCDLDVNSKIMLGLLNEIPAISSVGIDAPNPWERNDKHCHKSVCRFGIMDIGRSCGCLQNIAVLIRYYIALYTLNLFVSVNALLGARQRRPGTLTVNGSDGRVWRLASLNPDFLHKTVLKFGKGIHGAPTSEIVIHYLPFGIFRRQHAPLATADVYVDYSVKYEKKIIFATPVVHENCSFYILLLSIGQIGQIHISLGLFMFVHIFKQSTKDKCLSIRLMLISHSHLFLNKLLITDSILYDDNLLAGTIQNRIDEIGIRLRFIAVYLAVKKYVKVETVIIPQGTYTAVEGTPLEYVEKKKVVNQTGQEVIVMDSKWFKKIINDNDIPVRGFFRMQNKKNTDGEWYKELIFVDPFIRHGYHRNAKIEDDI